MKSKLDKKNFVKCKWTTKKIFNGAAFNICYGLDKSCRGKVTENRKIMKHDTFKILGFVWTDKYPLSFKNINMLVDNVSKLSMPDDKKKLFTLENLIKYQYNATFKYPKTKERYVIQHTNKGAGYNKPNLYISIENLGGILFLEDIVQHEIFKDSDFE